MAVNANRNVVAGFSLTLLCAAHAAHAQSSVTLYGVIDESVGYVHNASGNNNLTGIVNGNLQGSRWGFLGSEDLGSGLKAIFQLENGFDPRNGQSGQGGRMFGRQAFVGLASDAWGTVTLGRQYDPVVDMVQGITADAHLGGGIATPGDVDNYDDSLRASNSVKYTSPKFGGFQLEGLYGFSNLAGQTGQGYTYGGAASYSGGSLNIAAGYLGATNPSPTTPGTIRTTWTGSADPIFDGPINAGYVTAHSIGIATVAAQYVIGSLTAGASYSNSQYRGDAASAFGHTERYNAANAFVSYQIMPTMSLDAGYAYLKASGDTSAHYNQIGAGVDYLLSKRTDVYSHVIYQHASGTQRVENADGSTSLQQAQASIGSTGYAGTANQTLVVVGLRQKF